MIEQFLHPPRTPDQFEEPRWARFLFAGTAAAWLWLIVRLYMASVWIPAGWEKVTSGKWLFGDGAPITGFVGKAIADTGTPGWYATFLQERRWIGLDRWFIPWVHETFYAKSPPPATAAEAPVLT